MKDGGRAIGKGLSLKKVLGDAEPQARSVFHDYNPAHWELIHVLQHRFVQKKQLLSGLGHGSELALQHNQPFFPNNDIIRAAKPASIPIRELKPGVMRRKQQLFPDFTLESEPGGFAAPRTAFAVWIGAFSRFAQSINVPHRVSR